jgi:hypothetical protein
MSVPASVSNFVTELYKRSDVGPEGHQAYVDLYVPDATLIMGPVASQGHEGVRNFRVGAWEKISRRRHVCEGIFAHPTNPNEFMTYGTVDYTFKDGTGKNGVEFATRLVLDQSGAEPKIKFYQVFIVSTARVLWHSVA